MINPVLSKETPVSIERYNASSDSYAATSAPNKPLMVPLYKLSGTTFKEIAGKQLCKNYIGEEAIRVAIGLKAGGYSSDISDAYPSKCLNEGFYLLYRFNSSDTRDIVINNFKKLTRFEMHCKIPKDKRSCFSTVVGNDKDLVIWMSDYWTYASMLLSLHIQIVRVLVENTDKLQLVNHIKALIIDERTTKESLTSRDLYYFDETINQAGINLVHLVANVKKYINNNERYTGYNDTSAIAALYNRGSFVNIAMSVDVKKFKSSEYIQIDNQLQTAYLHDQHGVYDFSCKFKTIRDYLLRQDNSSRPLLISDYKRNVIVGFNSVIAYNYFLLLEEEKLITGD